MSKHRTIIFDKCSENADDPGIPTEVEIDNHSIYLYPEGYGDAGTENGYGCPVMIERWEGGLRVVIWGDINREDPTHIISLEGARENLRDPAYSS